MTSTPVNPNEQYSDMPIFEIVVEPASGTVPVDAVITVDLTVFSPDVGVS